MHCMCNITHKVLLQVKEFPESRLYSTMKYSSFVAHGNCNINTSTEKHMCASL